MSELYIDVQPNMYQSFLDIFDLPWEDGAIAYHLQSYDKKQTVTPSDIAEVMLISGWGVFGVASKVPELVEKMELEVVEQNGEHFVVFYLAPFLGLPGDNPIEELKELKALLEWIKEEAISNPKCRVKLSFSRFGDDVTLDLSSSSEELEQRLNAKFHERISQSEVLTKWFENQKLGFANTEKQCFDLSVTMDSGSLMSLSEKMDIFKQSSENKSPNIYVAPPVKKNKSFF